MAAQQIAVEIEHIQWMSGINTVLGMIYADLLIASTARRHLEQALAQGRESGSLNWTIMAAGTLASVMISEVQPEQAADLLKTVLQEITPARTVGQRIAWCAQAELALARNDWQDALAIINRLLSDSQTLDHGRAGVRVTYLHGQTLALSGDYWRAEQELLALQSKATALDSPGMLWRANASLAHVYVAQGDQRRAAEADSQAHTFINRIADNLADAQLRETFVKGALDWLQTGRT
jgi:ATP/maltotriose-dependent transcriptional regulator MalT